MPLLSAYRRMCWRKLWKGRRDMRAIRLAAIQPDYLDVPPGYYCLSEQYKNKPDEIYQDYIAPNIELVTGLLERAGRQGCDMVTTCEDTTRTGNYCVDVSSTNIFRALVEISYPELEKRLSAISAKYGMYVAGCYNKICGDRIYNVTTIFDRKGEICGEYRKVHLPPDETWQVRAGDSIEVFRLDFGTVGVCICYDMMFQETAHVLALKGAEVILHPTVGYGWYDEIGEATLRTRANDNGVYIATSKNYRFNGAGKSSIIDCWGHVLVDACYQSNAVVTAEIDLDVKKPQPEWYNPVNMSGEVDVRRRMERERRPELYDSITAPLKERFEVPSRDQQIEIISKIKSGQCRW